MLRFLYIQRAVGHPGFWPDRARVPLAEIGLCMADEHQTNVVIATAIIESFKDHPDHKLDPEEAKLIAKRILEALKDAGFQVTVVD